MRKLRELSSRFRLISSLAALVVLLAALSVTPVRADPTCEHQCWGWNTTSGCTDCHVCCVEGAWYNCDTTVSDKDCGTGGPGGIQ